MFGLSPVQLLICGVVAVLLFGSRLPSVARSLGKSLTEFRRGLSDLQSEFNDSMRDAERATETATAATGVQGRLPQAARNLHDDSSSDEVYDPYAETTPEEGSPTVEGADEGADEGTDNPADAATVAASTSEQAPDETESKTNA